MSEERPPTDTQTPPDGPLPLEPPSAPSPLHAQVQDAIGDAYRVEREISGGGMSRLFLATEVSLGRQVVVKILPPDFASALSAARFKREIELTAYLQHPHILPVLSAGARGGLLYYVMPYVAGESLRHRLQREGHLPVGDTCRILREMADALAFAHAQGIVHRDIKPENILLQGTHAVLADFGIAGALMAAQAGTSDGSTPAERLTSTGMAVGTPGYMAPEQLAGERNIDARVDIYALGMVGYEMLAGERPFADKTGPALLVARITEAPPPLDEIRDDVPAELADVIATSLANEPDGRYQTAAELYDALETVSPARTTKTAIPRKTVSRTARVTTTTARRRRLPRLGRWWAAVAALTVAGSGAAFYRAWHLRQMLTENLIAVMPFDVLYPPLQLWKEGLVDVLSRNLDDAGPLHTVSPTVVVRRWDPGKRADRANAVRLGRRLRAQYVVFGSLSSTGTDSVRLTAELWGVAAGRIGDPIDVRDAADHIDRLADTVTVRFLRELGQARAVGAFRGTTAGSRSLPALKAFLQGEQFYRHSAWDSAIANYDRAIGLDSTFSLALRRNGLAVGWRLSTGDSASRALLLRAGAHNRGLPARDSLLTAADSIRAALATLFGDPRYPSYARRLFATLERAAQLYPQDPEVWFALGDAHWHYPTSFVKITDRQVLDQFARTVKLDSAFAPAYIHLVDLSLAQDGAAAAQRYLRSYLALNPTDVDAEGLQLVARLLDPRQASSPAVEQLIDTLPSRVLQVAMTVTRRWPDSAETAIRLARQFAAPRGSIVPADTLAARRRLASLLAYRGHFAEADRVLGGAPGFTVAQRLLTGGAPPDSTDAIFKRWLAKGSEHSRYGLSWWAERRDTQALATFARRVDSTAHDTATSVAAHRTALYDAAAVKAYQALARRDTIGALWDFAALPDTLCESCYYERLTRARLLAARGSEQSLRDAAALLDEQIPTFLSPAEMVFVLERARIAEKLGDKKAAIAAYARVAATWRNADPALRPLVQEARQALQKLGGVKAPELVAMGDSPRR